MKGNVIKKFSFRSLFTGLLPLFVLAHFAHHLVMALPVPLLPLIRKEFALDYTQSGLVVSALTLPYGISQIPAGWLADRIGPRVLLAISISGMALGGLLVGLSQTYIMLLILLVLMGAMGGGYHPSAVPLVAASVEPEKQGRALGVHMIGGSASFFLVPLIAAAMAAAWGWRGSFIGLAVPAGVFGIVFYMLLRRWASTDKPHRVRTDSDGVTISRPGRLRRLVVFIILSAFTQAVTFSIVAFIPLFMVDHYGVSEKTAAAFLAIIYSAGLWASPLGGYLSDRFGKIPMTLIWCLMAGPAIYLLNVVPYGSGLGIGALLLVIGIGMYIRFPVAESYIISHTSERNRSMVYGIYYFSFTEAGGILTPAMGYLFDHFGFYTSFTIAGAALVAVTLVSSIWLWGSRN